MAVLVPLYKMIKAPMCDAKGDKINYEKGKTKCEEKTVFTFVICTIKKLHLLKVIFTKNLGLNLQIDGTFRLTGTGWVLMTIVLY